MAAGLRPPPSPGAPGCSGHGRQALGAGSGSAWEPMPQRCCCSPAGLPPGSDGASSCRVISGVLLKEARGQAGLTSLPFQVMEAFYTRVAAPGSSGATFLAVCRGKVRPLRSRSHTPGSLSPPGTCA